MLCRCLSFWERQRSANFSGHPTPSLLRLVNVLGALARSVQWQYLGQERKAYFSKAKVDFGWKPRHACSLLFQADLSIERSASSVSAATSACAEASRPSMAKPKPNRKSCGNTCGQVANQKRKPCCTFV